MKRNYKSKSIVLNAAAGLVVAGIAENLVDGIFNIKIKEAWEKAVEKKIFDYTKEIYVKGDILFIKVSNPILKQEILYSRQKVIDLINEDLGKELIKKIVLK